MISLRTGAIALAALATGCASLGNLPPSSSLIGDWVVENVDNVEIVARPTVTFDETSRISGSSGCNRFTGAYNYDPAAGALTVTPLGVTRMMCAPPLMAQEQRLIVGLQAATRVETTYDGATALISPTGRVVLRRRATAPAPAAQKAKPPATTAATPAPPVAAGASSPSTTQYPLSGGPATPVYAPPYASAPPPEPVAPTQVTANGELYLADATPLPPGAQVRIQLRDTARAGAPPLVLAQQDFDAGAGGPYPFSISAPMNVVPANARLGVTAQIRSGPRLLYVSDDTHVVSATSPSAPLRIRLASPAAAPFQGAAPASVAAPPATPVPPMPGPAAPPPAAPAATPAPATTLPAIMSGPTGPAPSSYRCGAETVRVAFDGSMAWMTTADGVIAVPRVNPSDDPFAQRMYSNNRVTFIQDQDSLGGGRVQFARGRAALLTCAKTG